MTLMIYGLVAGILAVTFLLTMQQRGVSQGMYRSFFVLGGLGLLAALLLPNGWLTALLALMIVNLLRDKMMGVHLSRATPLILMAFALIVTHGRLDRSFIPHLLVMIVSGGVVLSVQSAWFAWQQWGQRDHIKLYAGQENVNNTQSISVVCTCAAVALAFADSPLWWVAVPVVAFPMLWTAIMDWRYERSVTMGPVILLGVGLLALPLFIGWWAAVLLPLVIAGLVAAVVQALRFEKWWDSGRIRCWYSMLLLGWWKSGWTVRLLGRGWQSWVGFNDFLIDVARKTNRHHIVNTRFMMSTAHNEFVQILFEHGAVGLLLLSGYVLSALWQLGHGDVQAQAVYLVAVGMCGVACTLHPWTWTHGTITEVNAEGQPEEGGGHTILYTIGSPALNWLAFLTAVLVEVAR